MVRRGVQRGAALVFLGGLLCGSAAMAQEQPRRPAIVFQNSQDLPSVLRQYLGQTVTLLLASGGEVGGKVEKVGDRVVHLSRIAGKEYFDAVVSLDRVVAFELQVR